MQHQDQVDFFTAFAVGTVIGIGVTLLLKPKSTPAERIQKQWKPYSKQMRRNYKQTRGAVSEAADATGDMSHVLALAGRDAYGEFQKEASKVLKQAQKDLKRVYDEQTKELSKQWGKTNKKLGKKAKQTKKRVKKGDGILSRAGKRLHLTS